MDVHSISVRFARKVQVKDYEPVEGEITLSANMNPGEDIGEVATRLMNHARSTVIEGLRGGPAVGAAATPVAPKSEIVTKTETAPAGEKPAGDGAPAARPPGRPPETPEQKAAKLAAKKTAEAAAAAAPAKTTEADAGADIPDDTGGTKTTTGKPTTAATAAADDIPDDTAGTKTTEAPATAGATSAAAAAGGDEVLTADTLQSYITKMVQSKKLPVAKIKEILASHGVQRTSELPAADLGTVKDEIEMAAMA